MELDIRRIRPLLKAALQEDLGAGDVTSEAVVPRNATAGGSFVVREAAVVAGLPVAAALFGMLSRRVAFEALARDGDVVRAGERIARVSGPARPILAGERLSLNFLQRLSGIATLTRRCVEALRGRPVKIMDTRKTTPCWRYLERYAVATGGGTNHRAGLYDGVLIKDNHLRIVAAAHAADPVGWAVRRARAAVGPDVEIEVEVATVAQAMRAVDAGADIIMLDNMSGSRLGPAVRAIRRRAGRRIQIEVSGNVRLGNLSSVAAAGPDRVSLGALTHSAPAVDISLELD